MARLGLVGCLLLVAVVGGFDAVCLDRLADEIINLNLESGESRKQDQASSSTFKPTRIGVTALRFRKPQCRLL